MGKRYLCRGLDQDGHPANFVETEQLLIYKDEETDLVTVYSHVQIRGAVPLLFSSCYELKRDPDMRAEEEAAAEAHFQRLTDEYEQVTCVNLIDKSGV